MPESTAPTPTPEAALGQPLRVLLAGGGTAGHVNPLLATAAALRDPATGHPDTVLEVLGTQEGLEADLVPAQGLHLSVVPRVPMPRKPSPALFRLPGRLRAAVAAAEAAIEKVDAQVVVGFGGYVSTPAYLAAKRRGIPVVIHEQNARPGLANRLGARWAAAVALTFTSTPLAAAHGRTEVTGLPLRPVIEHLAGRLADPAERTRARREAAEALGLEATRPTLLVTGGSLGAQRLNEVMEAAMAALPGELQVLHLTGRGKDAPVRTAVEAAGVGQRYHVLDYLTDMHLAYALADAVVCRSGAGTVAELAALGLPALYVPLPIGNGEQRLNAADVVAAGGGRLIDDATLTPADILAWARLAADPTEREPVAAAAAGVGVRDGAAKLAALIAACATPSRA